MTKRQQNKGTGDCAFNCTCSCPSGVVGGRPAVRQSVPSLKPVPSVHGCVDGLVSPPAHCILKVTLKLFPIVALRGVTGITVELLNTHQMKIMKKSVGVIVSL